MSEHPPLPLTIVETHQRLNLRGSDGSIVAYVDIHHCARDTKHRINTRERKQLRAAYIVRACNAHEKLVEALENILKQTGNCIETGSKESNLLMNIEDIAQAALALAKEGQ